MLSDYLNNVVLAALIGGFIAAILSPILRYFYHKYKKTKGRKDVSDIELFFAILLVPATILTWLLSSLLQSSNIAIEVNKLFDGFNLEFWQYVFLVWTIIIISSILYFLVSGIKLVRKGKRLDYILEEDSDEEN